MLIPHQRQGNDEPRAGEGSAARWPDSSTSAVHHRDSEWEQMLDEEEGTIERGLD